MKLRSIFIGTLWLITFAAGAFIGRHTTRQEPIFINRPVWPQGLESGDIWIYNGSGAELFLSCTGTTSEGLPHQEAFTAQDGKETIIGNFGCTGEDKDKTDVWTKEIK